MSAADVDLIREQVVHILAADVVDFVGLELDILAVVHVRL